VSGCAAKTFRNVARVHAVDLKLLQTTGFAGNNSYAGDWTVERPRDQPYKSGIGGAVHRRGGDPDFQIGASIRARTPALDPVATAPWRQTDRQAQSAQQAEDRCEQPGQQIGSGGLQNQDGDDRGDIHAADRRNEPLKRRQHRL
jgi:hypothetical protein